MSRPRALTPDQAIRVVALFRYGMTQPRIAETVGTSLSVVSRTVTGRSYGDVTGVKIGGRRPGRRPRLPREQARRAHAELRRGASRKQIAKDFKVSRNVINRLATGEVHGDVTGIRHSAAPCSCKRCETGDTAARNMKRARTLRGAFECASCHASIRKTVGAVQKSGGTSRCQQCERGVQ